MSGQWALWSLLGPGKSFPRTTLFPPLRYSRCKKWFLKPFWCTFEFILALKKEKIKGKTSFGHKIEMVTTQPLWAELCRLLHQIVYIPKAACPDLVCWCCWIISWRIGSTKEKKNWEGRGSRIVSLKHFGVTQLQVMGLQPLARHRARTFLMGLHAMHMSGACVRWNWWIHQGRIPSGRRRRRAIWRLEPGGMGCRSALLVRQEIPTCPQMYPSITSRLAADAQIGTFIVVQRTLSLQKPGWQQCECSTWHVNTNFSSVSHINIQI